VNNENSDPRNGLPVLPGRGGGRGFLLMILIVLSVYAGINAYLLGQVVYASQLHGVARGLLFVLFIIWSASYPIGRMIPNKYAVSKFFRVAGAWYLAVMIYSLLFTILIDVFSIAAILFKWFPPEFFNHPAWSRGLLLVTAGAVLIIVVVGHIRSIVPKMREMDVRVVEWPEGRPPIRLALVSDLHLGAVVGASRVRRLVHRLEKDKPDLLCFVGDMVDEDPAGLGRHLESLKGFKLPLGIFGVTGNHEYYNGRDEAVALMEEAGIRVLSEEGVVIDDSFLLIGAEDRPGAFQKGVQLEPLEEMIRRVSLDGFPKILLHHTPVLMEEADMAGVALQISGHTHGGQIWPSVYTTYRAYGIAHGWISFPKGMRLYVTSGLGSWGPPVRVGSYPEIVILKLHG